MVAPYVKSVLEDQSTRVAAAEGIAAAIVIACKKGEAFKPMLMSNQTQLLTTFTPNQTIEVGWDMAYYEAYEYLKKSNKLWVVRCVGTGALFGGATIEKSTSANSNVPLSTGLEDPMDFNFTNEAFLLYANSVGKYAGDIGFKIETNIDKTKLEGAFYLYVYRKNTLVETHLVSLDPNLKNGYGVSCFIETVLKGSNYVRAIANEVYTGQPKEQATIIYLGGGDDGAAPTDADRIKALKKLENPQEYSVQLVMDGGNTTSAYHKAIIELCQKRSDATYGILSTPIEAEMDADALTAIKTYRKTTLNANTYVAGLYTPHQYIQDEFNDRQIIISPSCLVAANLSKVAMDRGWHWPAAGYNRGILTTLDVYKKFTPEECDELCDNQTNPIVSDPGRGIVIKDAQTLLVKASDLQEQSISNYLNIKLRPTLKTYLENFIYELNDEETRSTITDQIKLFMESEKGDRAVYEYRVVCDETNNTDSDIENNHMNVWLYVKPTKPAKFIEQKIIVTPYGIDLASIEI